MKLFAGRKKAEQEQNLNTEQSAVENYVSSPDSYAEARSEEQINNGAGVDAGGIAPAKSGGIEEEPANVGVKAPEEQDWERWERSPVTPEINCELSYEPDGVYFTLDSRAPMHPEFQQRLLTHLLRKNIRNMNRAAIQKAIMSNSANHILIAPAQAELIYDGSYSVSIENNHMSTYLTLHEPEKGKGKLLDIDTLLDELRNTHQVRFGLNEELVRKLLEAERYEEKTLVASGEPPIPGKDGALEFHFDIARSGDAGTLRQVADDEKVDYKVLDLFERVTKGQLLVTKIPPEEGIPGTTVFGKPVSAPTGKLYNLPVGKNTYVSDDKLKMYAKDNGRVDYINGFVEVSNCYVINGDVDVSTGNIDFLGDVTVVGNVRSDYQIKATGNIEVKGIVEASVLEAGKDIVIHGGVQGAGKGTLTAGGGVFSRFVEYSTVQASDIVVAESLLHSNVNCFGPIEVLNGRGTIIGGNVCAGTYIAARYLGNAGGRATQLEVGVSPAHRAELLSAEETVVTLKDTVTKLQRIVQLPSLPNETDRQKAARIEATRKLLIQKKILDDNVVVLERMRAQLEEMKDGQVHVLVTAYPGVVISIGFDRYSLRDPIAYATFRMENNEISFTSCRFKQQPTKIKRIKKR